MNYLIDPPDMLSGTLEEWRAHLTALRAMKDQDDEQVRYAIEQAERVIAQLEA